MSFTRRLRIRSSERQSERSSLHLIFAKPDYDCRRDVPRSLRFERWKATIADRLKNRWNA